MTYSSIFLANEDAARELLLEGGYSSAAATDAVMKIGELCICTELISQLASSYQRGEQMPAHFDVQLDVKPIHLRGSDSVNLIEDLENRNVLVPRGNSHRVMLSNLMNHIFTLTADTGDGSIRHTVSRLHEFQKFLDALDALEWELVNSIHHNIDMKYLNVDALQDDRVPELLLGTIETAQIIAESLRSRGIQIDNISEVLLNVLLKGANKKENLRMLEDYFAIIRKNAEYLEEEGKSGWNTLQGATKYPQSILNRFGPPLIKSSWHLKSDFKTHPLIEKFKELLRANLDLISQAILTYQSHITDFVAKVEKLPRGIELVEHVNGFRPSLPTSEELAKHWELITKHGAALQAQSRLLGNIVSSVDSLFRAGEN
jgi:hypothetical protein